MKTNRELPELANVGGVIKLIEAAEVKRDIEGYWFHPDEPVFISPSLKES